MQIKHDRSYISATDNEMICRGYGHEDLHSLRLQFLYTEDEKTANILFAETHTPDEWSRHCTLSIKQRSAEMQAVMESIGDVLTCYQYNEPTSVGYGSSDWELFFWCNDLYQSTSGCLSGRDYSYFTLSFNNQHGIDRKHEIYQKVMDVLSQFADNPNLSVFVQYGTLFNDDKINKDAEHMVSKLDGMRYTFQGEAGRFVKTKLGLFFMKKYAKSYGVLLSPRDILSLSWSIG